MMSQPACALARNAHAARHPLPGSYVQVPRVQADACREEGARALVLSPAPALTHSRRASSSSPTSARVAVSQSRRNSRATSSVASAAVRPGTVLGASSGARMRSMRDAQMTRRRVTRPSAEARGAPRRRMRCGGGFCQDDVSGNGGSAKHMRCGACSSWPLWRPREGLMAGRRCLRRSTRPSPGGSSRQVHCPHARAAPVRHAQGVHRSAAA